MSLLPDDKGYIIYGFYHRDHTNLEKYILIQHGHYKLIMEIFWC
jgi:hypothetical protein